jgi:nucleoside-diphosphate-sugar epimerase
MTVLVTGSSGHLGEALMRTLRASGRAAVGLDLMPGPFTDEIGTIVDHALVARTMQGVDAVLHVATLHKPHVATHAREAFVDTNIRGTLNLLEEAARARVSAFVMTSTTSTFGDALKPPVDQPAAWIDERVAPVPKNIYGVTKTALNIRQRRSTKKGCPWAALQDHSDLVFTPARQPASGARRAGREGPSPRSPPASSPTSMAPEFPAPPIRFERQTRIVRAHHRSCC